MARLTPSSLIPVAAAALLAYAWVASPQGTGVLDRAADALEGAGVVRVETVSQPPGTSTPQRTVLTADFARDRVVIEEPEDGVERRLVLGGDTYDLLADGTWVRPADVPVLYGQDIPDQLRALAGDVEQLAERSYRVRFGGTTARLDLGPDDVPRQLRSRFGGSELSWVVVDLPQGFLDVEPPARFRDVSAAEHQRLVAAAAGS